MAAALAAGSLLIAGRLEPQMLHRLPGIAELDQGIDADLQVFAHNIAP